MKRGKKDATSWEKKYRLETNTNSELAGQKRSQKIFGFHASDSDLLSDYSESHIEHGSQKKLKKTTQALQAKPGRGFGILSKRRWPYEE